jgi:hypothetical protein
MNIKNNEENNIIGTALCQQKVVAIPQLNLTRRLRYAAESAFVSDNKES